ncbi:Uncharacterized protein BM_BM8744 [Brugia malayi]|uniref:Bm8744 n=1 Tax=Brugia malayi TaxID=6279 RepID=A0A0J9XNI2_BRUMA|nr:Uncharacterized protein BM_BM8744 [Brugia malayi]CDP91942.1 Bm8744 [Brugia malayi]VIO88597.1 Uncharacterized protein BM_BM8744 [Brugia malayi]
MRILSSSSSSLFGPSRAIRSGIVNQQLAMDPELLTPPPPLVLQLLEEGLLNRLSNL